MHALPLFLRLTRVAIAAFAALAAAPPAAAVVPNGSLKIDVLEPGVAQPAGSPSRLAIHHWSNLSPPARVYSVKAEAGKVLIGLLWPADTEVVPQYERVTVVDLPPLAAGDWEVEQEKAKKAAPHGDIRSVKGQWRILWIFDVVLA